LLLLTQFILHSQSKESLLKNKTHMFTYNIQLAGYDYLEYDEKDKIDVQGFIKVIEGVTRCWLLVRSHSLPALLRNEG
jgi:hypothetical protein